MYSLVVLDVLYTVPCCAIYAADAIDVLCATDTLLQHVVVLDVPFTVLIPCYTRSRGAQMAQIAFSPSCPGFHLQLCGVRHITTLVICRQRHVAYSTNE